MTGRALYREARITDRGVHVRHDGNEDRWSSDVTVEADEEKTTVWVGNVTLEVSGLVGGCRARLTYEGQELWSGDYRSDES